MKLLFDLARQARVFEWRDRMFAGEKINSTENRAVLHVALRNRSNRPIVVDGKDVMPEVNAVLAKMRELHRRGALRRVEGAHRQAHHRHRQHRHRRQRPRTRRWPPWRSSPTGSRACARTSCRTSTARTSSRRCKELNPETDALHRREQDLHDAGDADERAERPRVARREAGDRGRGPQALRRGVHGDRRGEEVRHRSEQHVRLLGLGRRPLLALERHRPAHRAASIGMDNFEELLAGGHAMDEHFRTAPLEKNLPVVLGLLGVWYIELLRRRRRTPSCPTTSTCSRFAAYFQQGDMESNGKRVDRDGQFIEDYTTGPDRLGRAGHQRAARLLPAHPPGHAPGPVRLPRADRDAQPARAASRSPARELLRADRGAHARQDAGGGARRARGAEAPAGARGRARAAQDVPGQPADDVDPLHEADAAGRSAC